MRFWHVARWVFLIVWALALLLFLVRGPEDTWIRDSSGAWVAHGHPAGPPPPADYEPPFHERAVPIVVLAVFAGAIVGAVFLTKRSSGAPDALNRSIRYFGTVSMISTALAICLAVALILSLWSELESAMSDPGVIVLCLVGVIMLLKLLSWHADGVKRLLEAHYDLKRTAALLQDTVERLAADADGRHPSTG
jgi:hypothetical protein